MLARLVVSNLAIVEKVDAEFADGLNVITGETGAGKSVLMGALELVLGGRSDSEMIRDGANEARVEAVFRTSSAAVGALLDEAGLPPCENGELLVRRLIGANGSGRVWVNDSATTVSTLRKLGKILVDIHGPRANQRILSESFQRETLDAYGEVWKSAKGGRPASSYRSDYERLIALDGRLAELESAGAVADELDLVRYQVGEFDEAELTQDDEDLAARHAAAAHAKEIVEAADEVTEVLGGDDGVAGRLIALQPKFGAMARNFPEAEEWAGEAEELTLRVQELSRAVADAVSKLDVDPEDFATVDFRLGVVNRLLRKYARELALVEGKDGDIAKLLAICAAKRERLDALEHRDERIAELKAEREKAAKAVAKSGAALSALRRAAGEKLARAVTRELRDLGFLQAKFTVRLEQTSPQAHGCDTVVYMFEPNPGEPSRPLAEIASSGETARVMLALKGALAAHDDTDLLVFDEIDANVGGEIGRIVGLKMRTLAAHHQVIAITHLPQSAACGDRHLVVSKSVSGGRTRTGIASVDGERRVAELARMMGGGRVTEVVRRHAEELLNLEK